MMRSLLKRTLATGLCALALSGPGAAVYAQQLPPLIKMIVPFAPGASTDVSARALAQQLSTRLGVNVIVDNRAGASGMIGSSLVAKGPKDGSQLLFTSVSMITTAATTRNAPFDVKTDLVPVAIMYEAPLIFVVATNSPIRTPQDLVAAARANPDRITHGTGGIGTIAHLTAELFGESAKVQLKHVPYKGAALAVPDLISGTLDTMIAVNSTFGGNIKSGRLRAIGVTTEKPSPAFPGLPTMNTVAPGFAVSLYTAVFARAGTPPAIVQKLNHEINAIAKSKALADLLQSDGATPVDVTPQEASRRVRESYDTWKRLSTSRNIVID
jgi:tripartite-type tricarboxylate transporter receptor subunit TctC